jgi:hypothetical protein
MDHLTSPKLQHGVHCLNIRHKGMFVTSGPDPDEFAFYDKYDSAPRSVPTAAAASATAANTSVVARRLQPSV